MASISRSTLELPARLKSGSSSFTAGARVSAVSVAGSSSFTGDLAGDFLVAVLPFGLGVVAAFSSFLLALLD